MIYDVAIIGAGPTGVVTASQLCDQGHNVLIIQPKINDLLKIGETLPPSSRPLLEKLGLLKVVENGDHLISHGISSLWGSDQVSYQDHVAQPYDLGWHLNRTQFDQDLLHWLGQKNVTITHEWAKSFQYDKCWNIQTDQNTYKAHWLVDATGRTSFVAKKLGVERKRDLDQVALFTWVDATDTESRTFIEARPNGWWYTALIPNKKRVFCYLTSHQNLKESKENFINLLNETQEIKSYFDFDSKLDLSLQSGEACGARLNQFSGDFWLATGDAALSLDPLSSQGIYNALYTGMIAGQSIASSIDQKSMVPIKKYVSDLESIRTSFEESQFYYYQQEMRWSGNRFWQARHNIN